jgi:hypothetical protein
MWLSETRRTGRMRLRGAMQLWHSVRLCEKPRPGDVWPLYELSVICATAEDALMTIGATSAPATQGGARGFRAAPTSLVPTIVFAVDWN